MASTSPRRKELMEQIGIQFEIMPSTFDEDMTLRMAHTQLAEYLAYGKAMEVAKGIADGVVIGSDTFVVFAGKRLGKPKDVSDARHMLAMISEQWVEIYTGLAMIDVMTQKEYRAHEVTRVKIAQLQTNEIDAYIATGEPMDKAGAFAIQEKGAVFIEKISGCYTGVIGLPLRKLYEGLQSMGVDVWQR